MLLYVGQFPCRGGCMGKTFLRGAALTAAMLAAVPSRAVATTYEVGPARRTRTWGTCRLKCWPPATRCSSTTARRRTRRNPPDPRRMTPHRGLRPHTPSLSGSLALALRTGHGLPRDRYPRSGGETPRTSAIPCRPSPANRRPAQRLDPVSRRAGRCRSTTRCPRGPWPRSLGSRSPGRWVA